MAFWISFANFKKTPGTTSIITISSVLNKYKFHFFDNTGRALDKWLCFILESANTSYENLLPCNADNVCSQLVYQWWTRGRSIHDLQNVTKVKLLHIFYSSLHLCVFCDMTTSSKLRTKEWLQAQRWPFEGRSNLRPPEPKFKCVITTAHPFL